MNTSRFFLIFILIALLGNPIQVDAEDIDIYSGAQLSSAPNLMFVVDNPSSQNNEVGACTYSAAAGGGAPSNGSKALGNDQCALANIVASLATKADGTAVINLGITTMAGVFFKLTPIDDNPYTGTYAHPAGTTNRQAFLLAVKALDQVNGKSGQGSELQETWAYYTGGNDGSGSTGAGLLSGTTYTHSSTNASTGCQKNYIIYLSNVKAGASHAQEYTSSELTRLTASITNAVTNGTITAAQGATLSTIVPDGLEAGEGREWARFMKTVDINTAASGVGVQSIITYSVATGDTAVPPAVITNTMEKYIKAVATYGGGKYFPAGNDSTVLTNSILKILNEVQAVNSVFSSASLPVSVNAQGTYLNQIYMGMFRPDPDGNPRWVGNLKQYHFTATRDPVTHLITLSLSDSLDNSAVNPATGFISPNAVSYWTCGGSPSVRTCSPVADVAGGFWVNNPQGSGLSYDLPDGELVDKGGAAQIVRLANLIDNYATAAGTATNPRKLYTYCPSGSCIAAEAALSHVNNAFATTSTVITSSMFGSSSSLHINSIVRTGTTALVTTSSVHNYSNGTVVTISGATQPEYNVTQAIDFANPYSATTFTITGLPDIPTNPATGSYTVSSHSNAGAVTITSIARSSSSTATGRNSETATVTTGGHSFVNSPPNIQITGASPSDYNGSKAITVTNGTQFTYSVPVYPTATAANTYQAVEHPYSRTITSINKSGSNAVVTTTANHDFHVGQSVTISGTTNAYYNTTWTITAITLSTFTINIAGNPANATGGSVIPSATPVILGGLTRTGTTVAASAVATGVTAGTFANGDTLDITVNAGTAANESAYAINGALITCTNAGTYTDGRRNACTGTTFNYPITVTPVINAAAAASAVMQAAPLAGASFAISSMSRVGATVTFATRAASGVPGFGAASSVDISTTGAVLANESAYTGTWAVSAVLDTYTFTFGPVTLSPAASATGASMTAYQGSISPASAPLISWVRGEDNFGDELGPGGGVTVRPSLHGDVLHSRPVAVNYGAYPISITATSDSGGTRTAVASVADVATISALAATARGVTFANGDSCAVTVASATTFTYSTTNCGAAGAQAASAGQKVVVFYGGNDGVFRAVNGNQVFAITTATGSVPAGGELWGFIPTEFFSKFERQRSNSPILDLPSTIPGIVPTPQKKSYFADGSTGIYQKLNSDGTTNLAYLYISMRRGGQIIYALDVTDPSDPQFKWKIDPAGLTTNPTGLTASANFAELGQTWSAPKVAVVEGYANPVLIFGAGYDTAEDAEPPPASDTMGRGIYIVDAVTGTLVWRATYGAASACSAVGVSPATCTVSGMNFSIPADITLVDRDNDGKIDRLYAVDVGGNVWRVDMQRSAVNYTPDYWRVSQVASLGGSRSRKFFYPADVVPTTNYDAVMVGSGDREHPLYTNAAADKQNRLFMLKDLAGNDGSGLTTITKNDLFEKTTANTYTSAAVPFGGAGYSPNKGYFIDLLDGEKVVNAPLTAAGYTYFGTNQPTASNTCSANLGVARGYRLDPLSGAYTSTVFTGGGLPPSPVAGVVSVKVAGESTSSLVAFIIGGGGDPACVGADCSSAIGGLKPTITVPTTRRRTYWYQD